MEPDDAYDEGWLAYGLGKELVDNPFPAPSDEYRKWAEGWQDALAEITGE